MTTGSAGIPFLLTCIAGMKENQALALLGRRIVPTEIDAHSSNEKSAGAHILTRDEARRIAANIAKLPGLLLKRP